jgi:Zn-dependent peptidase ImmA (M78 family)
VQRGFKTKAENLALELRKQLELSPDDRLDPSALAEFFGIPVIDLPELAADGASAEAVRYLLQDAPEAFSAMTICYEEQRIIVVNPAQSDGRLANSLVHELAHVALNHEPQRAIAFGGCRKWSQDMEDEADWLSGALLVPRIAAVRIARQGAPVIHAADHFGVSVRLMEWRLNHTGARRQVERARQKRRYY